MFNHIRFGDGTDEIFFLHGWGGSCDSFMGVAQFLSSRYKVTLMDFYGFGLTPSINRPLRIDDYVLGVVEIAKKYAINKLNIVCHSFGGRVAIKLAVQCPNMIDKIIFVDSAGVRPRRGIKYYGTVLKAKVFKLLKIQKLFGSEDYLKLDKIQRETFKNIVNENLSKYLRCIKHETLLIWGDKDKDTPIYMGRKFHKLIANSKLVVFVGCGHFAYVERHILFCKIIMNFLDGGINALGDRGRNSFNRRNGTIKISLPFSK